MIIGSHVEMKAPTYLLGAVEQTINFGANTFMFYTGAPQNTARKPISEFMVEEALTRMKEVGIDRKNVIVHAPYIINLANGKVETGIFDLGVNFLKQELERTRALGMSILVLHPGAHVGDGVDKGIQRIIEGLDLAMEDREGVTIALETMSGKGSEIGVEFNELRRILEGVKYPERIGFCMDTCHLHDAGFDVVNDFDNVLTQFDQILGLERLKVIHINDSKNVRGAHKDRHENLGYGFIGFDAIAKVVHHPLLTNIPKILETPWINEVPPYGTEINMLRTNRFVADWRVAFE